MAGAKDTNRRLRVMLLKGLLLPGAAAAAIAFGSSAASADETLMGGAVDGVTSTVQSVVDASRPVQSGTDAAGVATSQPQTVTGPGDSAQSSTGPSPVEEAAAPVITKPKAIPEPASAATAPVSDLRAQPPESAPTKESTRSTVQKVQQVEAVTASLSSVTEPPDKRVQRGTADSEDLFAVVPSPLEQELRPAQARVTGSAEQALPEVTGAADQVAAAGRVTNELTGVAESVLRNTLSETAGTVDAEAATRSIETITAQLHGTHAVGTVTAELDVITRGLDNVTAPQTAIAAQIDAINGRLETTVVPPTESRTREVHPAATPVLESVFVPSDGPLPPPLPTPLPNPGSSVLQPTDQRNDPPVPDPATTTVPMSDDEGADASVAVPRRVMSTWWGPHTVKTWTHDSSTPATQTPGLPWRASPILPDLGSASLTVNSWRAGSSGSFMWLLLAVVMASLILRDGGLSQLTTGTTSMLSGRAAAIQDRPG